MKTQNTGNFNNDLKETIKSATEEKNIELSDEKIRFAIIFLTKILISSKRIDVLKLKKRTDLPETQFFETMQMLESLDLITIEKTRKKEDSPLSVKIKVAETMEWLVWKKYYAKKVIEKNEPRLSIPENSKITKRGNATIVEIPKQREKDRNDEFVCPLIISIGQCVKIKTLLEKRKEITLKELFETIKIKHNENSIKKLRLYLPRAINNFVISGDFPEGTIKIIE